MQELLKRLGELLGLCEETTRKAESKFDEYNRKVIALKVDEESITRRIQELDEREAKVKEIEDVVQLHKDAKELMSKGTEALKEADIRVKALDREQSRLAEINQAKTIEANNRLAAAKLREDDLKLREEAFKQSLDQARGTLREQLIEEFKKKLQ